MSILKKQSNQITPEEKMILSNKCYLLKNVVFISNIPKEFFTKEILFQKKFLGQYGHINQICLINNNKIENSLIVHFDTINQAALAIIALNNFEINDKKIKISYYNTRYCHFFLNNKECPNPNCFYIHTNKINDYIMKEIKVNEYINSFMYALTILNISYNCFQLIYEKIIGENFFEKFKKFPKITVKKLKNEEYKLENKINVLKKNLKGKKNLKKSKSKSDDNSVNNIQNLSNENYSQNNSFNDIKVYEKREKRRTKKSRFQFVRNKENQTDKVNVPDFILNTVDKILKLYIEKKNKDKIFKNINIVNFNANWSDLVLIKNIY
jgi:hypothetical protein